MSPVKKQKCWQGSLKKQLVQRFLNKTYSTVMKSQVESVRKSLRESQRAWLKYHILECNARNTAINGGDALMRSNALLSCINDFYKQRISELDSVYCQNSDGCLWTDTGTEPN